MQNQTPKGYPKLAKSVKRKTTSSKSHYFFDFTFNSNIRVLLKTVITKKKHPGGPHHRGLGFIVHVTTVVPAEVKDEPDDIC